MNRDLETKRVVNLRCLEIHRLAISVFVSLSLLLLLLLLLLFWSSSLRPDELPWWFFQASFR